MKFKLRENLYNLLINIPEVKEYINSLSKSNNFVEFDIDKADFRETQLLINDEIVLHGMDNQDTINSLGTELYKLYDEILYQKNNQSK